LAILEPFWRVESLTQRALGEAPGSPREAESSRSAPGRGKRLLSNGPGSKGTNGASNGGHFGSKVKRIGELKRRGKWEGRV